MLPAQTISILNKACKKYNVQGFLADDPVQIPHQFSKKEDIEIMAFFAATLAWGQRVSIINSCKKLITLFDNSPHDFILNHSENDLKRFEGFVHRTFNTTDLLYFIHFLKQHYTNNTTLETAFTIGLKKTDEHVGAALENFHNYFCNDDFFPARTRKHVATPARGSACKRLNMFLRWMVRHDKNGVDFGLWKTIKPTQLLIPLDVHVERVARQLNLIQRPKTDFQTVIELTNNLKFIDPKDPVKLDFALFGLGVNAKNTTK
jgi:uncharacterized protein (TIGR02757 family)